MVTYVTKLLLTITETTKKLISVIFEPYKEQFENQQCTKLPLGEGDLYSQSKDQYNCIKYTLYMFLYTWCFLVLFSWSDRHSNGFVTYLYLEIDTYI